VTEYLWFLCSINQNAALVALLRGSAIHSATHLVTTVHAISTTMTALGYLPHLLRTMNARVDAIRLGSEISSATHLATTLRATSMEAIVPVCNHNRMRQFQLSAHLVATMSGSAMVCATRHATTPHVKTIMVTVRAREAPALAARALEGHAVVRPIIVLQIGLVMGTVISRATALHANSTVVIV
jgi:hypothetical protein